MSIKVEHLGPGDNLGYAVDVRRQVFQVEQGISPTEDFDGNDEHAEHFVAYDGELGIGTGRYRVLTAGIAKVERVAVLPSHRGKGIGQAIMNSITIEASAQGLSRLELDAQVSAAGFYEKLGYRRDGEEFDEVGIPHVKMVLDLMESEPPVPIEATPIKPLFVAEADELETGVEPTGASQQTRENAIRSAQEFRRVLIEQTFKRIKEVVGRDSRLGTDRKRFMKTERRRQNYIETYEARAREWVDELLSRLDPEDETDQAFITNQLKEIFIALKYRLLIVEMETRRLAFFIYGESTGTKETRQERINRVVYESGEEELDIAELILAEIDGMRREQGMTDHAIFRQLVKQYHEDVSDMPKAKEITQLVYGLYDAAQQRFII